MTVNAQDEAIVQLVGYTVVGDVIEIVAGLDRNGCAQRCFDSSTPCVGFQFNGSGCAPLTWIRNIIEEASTCDFYVLDKRNSSSTLSETDQLVFYNAYEDQACPAETEDDGFKCSVQLPVSIFKIENHLCQDLKEQKKIKQ